MTLANVLFCSAFDTVDHKLLTEDLITGTHIGVEVMVLEWSKIYLSRK